jgi:hypothetical protein
MLRLGLLHVQINRILNLRGSRSHIGTQGAINFTNHRHQHIAVS